MEGRGEIKSKKSALDPGPKEKLGVKLQIEEKGGVSHFEGGNI